MSNVPVPGPMVPEESMTPARSPAARLRTAVLVIGFGTAVVMWTVGFLCRIPPAVVPGPLLLAAMMACLAGGGLAMGRLAGHGPIGAAGPAARRSAWRCGALAGLVTSVINLLIISSLLGNPQGQPNELVPSAFWWVPGSLLVGAALGAIGAIVGGRPAGRRSISSGEWTAWLARIDVLAVFILVTIGGLVTSQEAGLAVPDWPNSFGTNMFLFPLAKMVGGAFYEHSHRLFGTLVGLTTIVLVIRLWVTRQPRGLRLTGTFLLAAVIVQGILGGLRVTGRLTFESSFEVMEPSITLAIIHGVLGQCVLGLAVALVVLTTRTWIDRSGATPVPRTTGDRVLGIVLVGCIVIQLVLGALVRHLDAALMVHLTWAVVVIGVTIGAGLRAWGVHAIVPALNRSGLALLILIGIQATLGFVALIASGATRGLHPRPAVDVILTSAHQAVGAILLAAAVWLMLMVHRLLGVAPRPDGQPAEGRASRRTP